MFVSKCQQMSAKGKFQIVEDLENVPHEARRAPVRAFRIEFRVRDLWPMVWGFGVARFGVSRIGSGG